MTDLINHHQAIQGLRDAVAERGRDYVDPLAEGGDCQYVIGDRPGCIGGTALHKIGVPLEELQEWEGNTVEGMVPGQTTFGGTRRDAEGFLTVRACQVLSRAQDLQDGGDTWGDALDSAEVVYREILRQGESQ